MVILQVEHHALCTQQSGVGLSYGDEEDGEIRWKVHNVMHKGSREDFKDMATLDGHNSGYCHEGFVEEGLGFGSYLLGVEFAAED